LVFPKTLMLFVFLGGYMWYVSWVGKRKWVYLKM
jgi:hypothetical protein